MIREFQSRSDQSSHLMLAIMTVLQLPPSESFNSRVSLLLRYGTCTNLPCNQQQKRTSNCVDTHSRHLQSRYSRVLVIKQQTVYLVISKSIDTVPQGQQWLVDVGPLPKPHASIGGHRGSFRASQVNKWHLGTGDLSRETSCASLLVHIHLREEEKRGEGRRG